MGTLLAKQQCTWSDVVHCFLLLTCFTQGVLLVPMATEKKPNTSGATHFIAAVYNHRTIMPDGPDKADWDYAKSIIAQNLDIYEEQISDAAKQVQTVVAI